MLVKWSVSTAALSTANANLIYLQTPQSNMYYVEDLHSSIDAATKACVATRTDDEFSRDFKERNKAKAVASN